MREDEEIHEENGESLFSTGRRGKRAEERRRGAAAGLKALLCMAENVLRLWYEEWEKGAAEGQVGEQSGAEQVEPSAEVDIHAPDTPFPSSSATTAPFPKPGLDDPSLPTPSLSPPSLPLQDPLRAVLHSALHESVTSFGLAIRLTQSKFDVLPYNVELGRTSSGTRSASVTLENGEEATRMIREMSGKVLWAGAEPVYVE